MNEVYIQYIQDIYTPIYIYRERNILNLQKITSDKNHIFLYRADFVKEVEFYKVSYYLSTCIFQHFILSCLCAFPNTLI